MALTTFAQNLLVDAQLRGQPLVPPAILYAGLVTVLGTDVAAGTEVTGGSYARAVIASSLANWSGTQGAGTTAVSSGATGISSNNNPIAFPAPSAGWGTALGVEFWDAATGGNRWFLTTLSSPVPIAGGGPAPTFAPASLELEVS